MESTLVNAQEIKSLRLSLGWTQTELAAEVGVQVATVSNWETGKATARGAGLKNLQALATQPPKRKKKTPPNPPAEKQSRRRGPYGK